MVELKHNLGILFDNVYNSLHNRHLTKLNDNEVIKQETTQL